MPFSPWLADPHQAPCLPAALSAPQPAAGSPPATCTLRAPALPDALANLTRLQRLDLYGNGFGGSLPLTWATLGALPSLSYLRLAFNNLSGTLPPAWGAPGALPALAALYLNDNALSGGLPAEWGSHGGLQRLEMLFLGANNLTGGCQQQGVARLCMRAELVPWQNRIGPSSTGCAVCCLVPGRHLAHQYPRLSRVQSAVSPPRRPLTRRLGLQHHLPSPEAPLHH